MPLTVSPLSRKADPEMLKVPSLPPPTKMAVSKTVPNPVAGPPKFTWMRTLPAGPGEVVVVIIFIENSPIAFAVRSPVRQTLGVTYPFTGDQTTALPQVGASIEVWQQSQEEDDHPGFPVVGGRSHEY